LLVDALELTSVPRPLDRVLAHVRSSTRHNASPPSARSARGVTR
jgi:hypothetical protein